MFEYLYLCKRIFLNNYLKYENDGPGLCKNLKYLAFLFDGTESYLPWTIIFFNNQNRQLKLFV